MRTDVQGLEVPLLYVEELEPDKKTGAWGEHSTQASKLLLFNSNLLISQLCVF